MGGLRKYMPITAGTFIVGWLAIAGVFPFAGFWSKDEILAKAWFRHNYALWAVGARRRGAHRVLHDPPGVARLLRRRAVAARRSTWPTDARPTAHGAPHEPHESPWIMTDPAGRARRRSSLVGGVDRPAVRATASSTCSTAGSRRSCGARPRSRASSFGAGFAALDGRARRSRSSASSSAARSTATGSPPTAPIPTVEAARRVRARCSTTRYYFDVGLARFVSGPVTAFARFLSDGVDRDVIDGAVNGIGHTFRRVGRRAAQGADRSGAQLRARDRARRGAAPRVHGDAGDALIAAARGRRRARRRRRSASRCSPR